MKKCLMIMVNNIHKEDIELLYGPGSYVTINEVRYSTNGHYYSIDCTLHVKDVDSFNLIQNDGINYIMEESWKYTGLYGEKFMLVNSFELI
jgi:hypothetical protein